MARTQPRWNRRLLLVGALLVMLTGVYWATPRYVLPLASCIYENRWVGDSVGEGVLGCLDYLNRNGRSLNDFRH